MRIGEVADRLAVNPKTIRYYESVGLIPEPRRTESGYRDYDEEDFDRIRFIKTARRLDLALNEIREILAFETGGKLRVGMSAQWWAAEPESSMIESPRWRDCATSSSRSREMCQFQSEIKEGFVH